MSETNIMKQLMIDVGSTFPAVRIFRNNTGQGWVGEVTRVKNSNRIIIDNPRPLHAGLCVGSSDLVGWTTVEITPDMVGRKVAVFTALETKSPRGDSSDDQKNFIKAIRRSGGKAGVARCIEDVKNILLEVNIEKEKGQGRKA